MQWTCLLFLRCQLQSYHQRQMQFSSPLCLSMAAFTSPAGHAWVHVNHGWGHHFDQVLYTCACTDQMNQTFGVKPTQIRVWVPNVKPPIIFMGQCLTSSASSATMLGLTNMPCMKEKKTYYMWFPCKHEITTTSWAGSLHRGCVMCSALPKLRLRKGLDPISQAEAGPEGTMWKLN